MSKKNRMFNPPHPGGVLKRLYIEPMGLTVTETAKALRVTRKNLSEVINEHTGISPEMAIRLSKAFNTTPESWLNMQQEFDLWHATQKMQDVEIDRLAA